MQNFTTLQTGFLFSLTCFFAGAAGSLMTRKNPHPSNVCGNVFAAAGSILGIVSSAAALHGGETLSFRFSSSFPLLSFSVRMDALSAFFALTISTAAFLCSIFAIGYVKHFYGKYDIGILGFFYNIFIACMLLVVTADNGLFFLMTWELMSLASYFLVIFEYRNKDNIQAGSLYFIMTHIGTAFIILSFILMFHATGSFDFQVWKVNALHVSPLIKNLSFFLLLAGFGTKAGIIPLHIWLPAAHPAAPSHVSALMSGVMIKTGIYMFIRMFFYVFQDVPYWWGAVMLLLGSVSSLLGVLYALAEHDIKKLLAYHSIENIGIILLGIGSALLLSSSDSSFAAVGLAAALYHTLNHAVFKSLLFMGAGAVINATHTRSIEEYGGLIKRMPYTALFFLTGSMAISALPPLNGFFSEWLTFQSIFHGISASNILVKGIFLIALGSLSFTGGLAAACFVKVFGATFLARPRSHEAEHASECALSMKAGMGMLAALTLLLGFFSANIVSMLSRVVHQTTNFPLSDSGISTHPQSITLYNGFADLSMPALSLSLLFAAAGVILAVYFAAKNRNVRTGATWDCGTALQPRMEITSTGFARSIITIFKGILQPTKQTDIEYHDSDIRYFPKTKSVVLGTDDVYRSHFYKPLQEFIIKISESIKHIQSGSTNAYVAYIFIMLIALLALYFK